MSRRRRPWVSRFQKLSCCGLTQFSNERKGQAMIRKRSLLLSLAASALALAAPLPASAQNYPDKPVRLIVAVAAGGPMDTMARAVAQQMQTRLGQPVIVENRPGAGTTIGAKAVVNAEPDGLTLLWGTLSM